MPGTIPAGTPGSQRVNTVLLIMDLRLTGRCVPSDPPPGLSIPEAYSNSSNTTRKGINSVRSMRAPAFHTCSVQKPGSLLTCPTEDAKSVSGLSVQADQQGLDHKMWPGDWVTELVPT